MSSITRPKHARGIAAALIALALAALACSPGLPNPVDGLGGGDNGGGDEPPQGGVADEGRTFVFTGLNVQQLDSYEAEFDLSFAGQRAGGVEVDVASAGSLQRQREPKLLVVDTELSGAGAVQGMDLLGQLGDAAMVDVQLITSEGTLYLTGSAAGESVCRLLPADAVNVAGLADQLGLGAVQVEELVDLKAGQDPVRLDLVGQETVNGVTADHYQALNAEIGSLTRGAIDLWYVPGEQYVTRLSVDGEGRIPLYGSGALTLTYDVVSTNQPVVADIPADCTELNLEDLNLEDLNLEDLDLENLDLPSIPGS